MIIKASLKVSEFITISELEGSLMGIIFGNGFLAVSSFATNKDNLDSGGDNADNATNNGDDSEINLKVLFLLIKHTVIWLIHSGQI